MSEIGETMQIVELTGKGAFMLGKASIQAIQFFLQLLHSKEQKAIRLKYGELSLGALQEKQALMGDTAVVFQVATQDENTIDIIKKELTERGITFSQLADFDKNDGLTQFYSLGSDSAKLNAFFKQNAALEAGTITLDEYRNTASDEQQIDLLGNAQEAFVKSGGLVKKNEFSELLKKEPIIFQENAKLENKEMKEKYNYHLFKMPETEDQYIMVPTKEVVEMEKLNAYEFRPGIDTEYTVISKEEGLIQGKFSGEELYQKCNPKEYEMLERSLEQQAKEQKAPILNTKKNPMNEANRLRNDSSYMQLVHQSGARELTINRAALVEKENAGIVSVRVPNTGATIHVDLPQDKMREIDNGRTYITVIDINKKYNGSIKGVPSEIGGEELHKYFSDPIKERKLDKVKLVTPKVGKSL